MTIATNATDPGSAVVEADEPGVSAEQDDYLSASYCTVPPTDQTDATAALDDVKAHELAPEVAALRTAGFKLLLDHGLPVELDDWAEAAGVDQETIGDVLNRNAGRVQLDDQGRLLGIAGLTIEPSGHELDINGQKRWTWCALDAVGILGALEATGTIRSTDPRTGATVTIEFMDGQPQGGATIFVLGGYDGGNIREEWCPLVNFFNTRSDAETWVQDNQLNGDILTVRQITGEASEMWQAVTDPTHHRPLDPTARRGGSIGERGSV